MVQKYLILGNQRIQRKLYAYWIKVKLPNLAFLALHGPAITCLLKSYFLVLPFIYLFHLPIYLPVPARGTAPSSSYSPLCSCSKQCSLKVNGFKFQSSSNDYPNDIFARKSSWVSHGVLFPSSGSQSPGWPLTRNYTLYLFNSYLVYRGLPLWLSW